MKQYFGSYIGLPKIPAGRDAFINPIELYEMRIDKEFDTIVLYFAALRTWPDQLTDSSGHNVQIQSSASLTAHS